MGGGGAVPLFRGEAESLTQCRLGRIKWHLDPSNRLATIHQPQRDSTYNTYFIYDGKIPIIRV